MAARASVVATSRTANRPRRTPPFGAPHSFVLLVVDGEDPRMVHRIIRPETIVGRGEASHFVIDDDQVSRVHCTIRVDGPTCTITDRESTNGTIVNGRRLASGVQQRLRHLDEIEIGGHRLLLLAGRSRSLVKKGAA